MPCPAIEAASPSTIPAASSRRAALMIVAFSRSSRPTRPISCDSEIGTSGPSSSATISAARCSNSVLTGEKTELIATERTPCAAMSAQWRRSSSGSSAEMGLPSNSWPPCARYARPAMAATRRCGQSTIGGSDAVAGSPRRSAAVGASRRASTSALMKCVVPIMTAATSDGANGCSACSASSAVTMPDVTSGVVAALTAPSRRAPSISTASVLVPPTSIPILMLSSRYRAGSCTGWARSAVGLTPTPRTSPSLPATT